MTSTHWCTHCRGAIYQTGAGWYHRRNASRACRPGWSSTKAEPR